MIVLLKNTNYWLRGELTTLKIVKRNTNAWELTGEKGNQNIVVT